MAKRGNATIRAKQRAALLAAYGPDCQRCGNLGTEVDHIIELQDWPEDAAHDAEDVSNLQLLCHACHVYKTNQMRARRNAQTSGFFSSRPHPSPQTMSFPSPIRIIRPPMRLEPVE